MIRIENSISKILDEIEIKSKLYDDIIYGGRVLRNSKQKYCQNHLK